VSKMKAVCKEQCKIKKHCSWEYEIKTDQPIDKTTGWDLPRFCIYSEDSEQGIDLKNTKTGLTINQM